MTPQPERGGPPSAARRALRTVLVAARWLVGSRSAPLRSMAGYLILLGDQGRHAEVDALLLQGFRKLLPVRRPSATRWALPADPLVIDAATQRLDRHGAVVPKSHVYRYPSSEAPVLASVVIPCFNYGRYIVEAVESCRAQTLRSCEIVVVDDGSTDPDTISILDNLEGQSDLVVIRQANAGLPAARNAGIAVACGEFVCCLDADDVLAPTYLEAMVSLHAADSSVGFTFSHVRFFGDRDEVWRTRDFDPETALISNFTSVAAVFRRDDWAEIGGYSPAMRGGFEDWEFWIRLAMLGRRGRVAEVPLFGHRRHGHTMTHEAKAMEEELRGRIRMSNPSFFTDHEVRSRIGQLAPARPPSFSVIAEQGNFGGDTRKACGALLVIVPWLKLGGAEFFLLKALRGSVRDRRIVLVTTRLDPHPLAKDFAALTSDIFHLPEMLPPAHWTAFVEALASSRDVSRVLTSGSTFGVEASVAIKTLHPHVAILSLIHNHAPDTPFRTAVSNAASIDGFLAVSSDVEAALRAGKVPDAKILPIANGVEADGLFRPAGYDPASARSRLGIEPRRPLLLFIGRLAAEKRPLAFLDILEDVAGMVDVQAAMIGEGDLTGAVDRRLSSGPLEGRVTRIDALDQSALPAWYEAADMLVLTSSIEGMPGAVLEALAMGCPVAATEVGDIGLVLKPGINGFLVPPGSPRALSPLVGEALRNKRFAERREAIRETFLTTRFLQTAMVETLRAALSQTRSTAKLDAGPPTEQRP